MALSLEHLPDDVASLKALILMAHAEVQTVRADTARLIIERDQLAVECGRRQLEQTILAAELDRVTAQNERLDYILSVLRRAHFGRSSERVRKALRQTWELGDAEKAEKLLRNLARRLEREAPGVSGSILEGLDEMLTVTRLGLPAELSRYLACTNIIENMNGTIQRVCRNVKHWADASMALHWTGAGMIEAAKGFRRPQAALKAHQVKHTMNSSIERKDLAALSA